MLDHFLNDLRYCLRSLLKKPSLVIIVVITLALGVGANTAVYSAFHHVVAQTLQVPNPQQLVNLKSPGPKAGWTSTSITGSHDSIFSYPMFRDLIESDQQAFAGIAGHRDLAVNIAFEDQTLAARGTLVSPGYFPTLRVQPALGRLLGPQDDAAIGEPNVAVLSHAFWTNNLAAASDVVGRIIRVNGAALRVVGVAPAGFHGTTIGLRPQIYAPLTLYWKLSGASASHENRRGYWVYAFARLGSGVSMERADDAINRIYSRLINEVEAPLQIGMDDGTLAQFKAKRVALEPGAGGQSQVSEVASQPMVLLMAVSALVLLVACLNTANLLLARATARAGEMAVRSSLGANRGQIVRQQLTESLVLAVLGGLASIPVAIFATRSLITIMPSAVAPILSEAGLDTQTLVYAFLVSLTTVVAFGLVPALHAARTSPLLALKGASGQTTGNRSASRFRHTLATAQIALSMVSLVVAGLFIQSLNNLDKVDLGMRIDGITAFRVSPARNGYDGERNAQIFAEIESELAALPGVTSVTSSSVSLLSGSDHGITLSVEGQESSPGREISSFYNEIGTSYFDTLGVPVLAGREFDLADGVASAKVAIVNRSFAERYGWGADAVGKRLAQGTQAELDIEIVGLVEDSQYNQVKGDSPAQVFLPRRQNGDIGSTYFYVLSSLPAAQIMPGIGATISKVDPTLPVERLRTMPQQVDELLAVDRVVGLLCAAFAIVATLLAAGGVYGSLSYSLSQRRREIGLRLALGAEPARVQADALKLAARMFVIGGGIGLVVAVVVGRGASALLFGLEGHDPVVLGSAVALLGIVALFAAVWPARRAAKLDPVTALRWN